jgi:diaminohydroxyphosphoribosylaminopyrimidine deaminase/5-amino-6-(5-phosphoribosylamino)uracil reductase
MQRCLELALLGKGSVSPNPMVGAVIVHDNRIIGEGFHQKYGGPHAEVNAIQSVKDKNLLPHSTIYVSLEPCSHFGKTPPCTDLIIENKIPRVVIGSIDPFAQVCGNGVKKLQDAGTEVILGVLEEKSKAINPFFFTFQEKNRPFVILKWAETEDGFVDQMRSENTVTPLHISSAATNTFVHQLRSEIDAILIGKNTALLDNPQLTTRKVYGKNPLRVVIDSELELPRNLHLFSDGNPTLVLNTVKSAIVGSIEYYTIETISPSSILEVLYEKHIQSVMIEGGPQTIHPFIESGLWDKIYRIKSSTKCGSGVAAPSVPLSNFNVIQSGSDNILVYEK